MPLRLTVRRAFSILWMRKRRDMRYSSCRSDLHITAPQRPVLPPISSPRDVSPSGGLVIPRKGNDMQQVTS